MVEIGEEHPYEWVEPRRMGVLREYSQGPFVWLVSAVELIPRARGRNDAGPPPPPGAEELEDPRRVALGGGRRPPQPPGERLSPHRRDREGSRPSRRDGRVRSVRGARRVAGPAAAPARSTAGPFGRAGRRRGGRRAAGRAPGPADRSRRSPGSGRSPWPSGSDSTPTRSSPPACTARARDCSSCTGTCSARFAASPARSRTRSARSPSMPTVRPATSTSSSTSPTRSS